MINIEGEIHPTIAAQNDQFRRHPGPDWIISPGVQAKGPLFVMVAIGAVRAFDALAGDNDPQDDHDFGAFNLGPERPFWKIDCYDKDLAFGSPDPTDPSVTRRILTVM